MLKHKGRKALKKLLRCRECLQGSNEASDGARTEDRGSDVSMGISALRSPRSAHRRTLMPMLTSETGVARGAKGDAVPQGSPMLGLDLPTAARGDLALTLLSPPKVGRRHRSQREV